MSRDFDNQPLPYGWVKEFNYESGVPFYVDTKASPPRSTWFHPYEDEQYLEEHPDVQEKVRPELGKTTARRRHSYHGYSSSAPVKKRNFLGRLKDKAIGTKEEREAEKRRRAEVEEQYLQQRAQAMHSWPNIQQSQSTPSQGRYYGFGRPHGAGMGMGFGGGGLGMGGMALPLFGGMAGGLLLGDMLDDNSGYGGYGGGYGDGGFGDGGFGGGGFGGGGFGDGGFGGGGFGGGF